MNVSELERERERERERAWISLVEGDEQLDRPKSQTSMEICMHMLHNFFGFVLNTAAYHFGQYILHLLPLKSSVERERDSTLIESRNTAMCV